MCAQASLRNALKYLAAKQRVQSTMILRRDTGSILHVDGQIAASTTAATASPPLDSAASSSQQRAEPPESHGADPNETADKGVSGVKVNAEAGDSSKAQKLAELAWRFASVAGEVAVVLEGEEKIGLLRLRTGKHEVIIVPGE